MNLEDIKEVEKKALAEIKSGGYTELTRSALELGVCIMVIELISHLNKKP